MNGIVVAGIGTEIGKTFIASILTESLEADYWKPVQAGSLHFTDTDFVRAHISNRRSVLHPEAYRLVTPMSPHAAAAIDNVTIDLERLQVPATSNRLVIELAGGLMVPLNNELLNIDLLKYWGFPVILVSRNYLGSINHTLLSVSALRQHGLRIAGIIFNGQKNKSTEEIILKYTGLKCIVRTNEEREINKEVIKSYAVEWKSQLEIFL